MGNVQVEEIYCYPILEGRGTRARSREVSFLSKSFYFCTRIIVSERLHTTKHSQEQLVVMQSIVHANP